jgi:RNA polymerase sigma-70 factor (ECF subfamily)
MSETEMETKRTRMLILNESRLPQTVPLETGSNRYAFDSVAMRALHTDDDLVQAAQSGDNEAFAELCRRHAQLAGQRILGIVRHREDAEDALQETLLRAYANIGRFRQSSKFSTWITAIGINAALSVLRKRKSRQELDIEPSSPEEPSWDIVDQAPDPERRVAKRQMLLLLHVQLQALPPKMREVVVSYYGQDYSLKEAADKLGLSVPAVKSRLLRGRRSLRSSFERKGLLSSSL